MRETGRSRTVFWFSVLQFCYWTMSFVTDGVYAGFLRSFGYSESFIGGTLVLTGLAGLLLLPASGFLADRFSNFRLMTALSFLLMGGMLPVVLLFEGSAGAVCVYAFVGGGFVKVTAGLLESWMNKMAKEDAALDYGRVRSVGSISYAVMAAALGWVFSRLGYGVSAPLSLLLLAAGMAGCFKLPNPKPDSSRAAGPSLSETAGYLLRNRAYLLFLFCSFLLNITTQSLFSFLPLLVEEAGGGVGALGLASFLLAFCEFWVVRRVGDIARRIGIGRTFGIGVAGNFVKSFCYGMASSVPQVYLCSLTQCFSFALAVPGGPLYLAGIVDRRYLATAQLVSSTLATVVIFCFSGLYGQVAEQLTTGGMLRLFSLPALVGGVLFLLLHRRAEQHAAKRG